MQWLADKIPTGDAGLAEKMRRLRGLVRGARRDPRFRQQVLEVIRNVPERDYMGEVRAISSHVRRMRYTRDPNGVELFTDPRLLANQIAGGELAAGDCDDHVGLAAAMLEVVGRPTRFVVGGEGPGQWRHIWLEAEVPGRGWVSIDDTNKAAAPGWSPADKFDAVADEGDAGYRGGMMRYRSPSQRITKPARGPFYGGAAACQMAEVGLAGFSLKKLGKKINKAVKDPIKKVLPKEVYKPLSKVAESFGKVYRAPLEFQKRIVETTMPLWGAALNTVAPGAGQFVDTFVTPVAGRMMGFDSVAPPLGVQRQQFRALPQAPPAPPPPPPQPQPQQGGGDAGSAAIDAALARLNATMGFGPQQFAEGDGDGLPGWVLPVALGGAALVAVFLIARRR